MTASQASMGFLRSLYFEQVKKSIADEKEREAKEAKEKAEMKTSGYDRANKRLNQMNVNKYNNRMRNNRSNNNRRPPQQRLQRNIQQPQISSFNSDDLEDALEEME